MHRKWKYLKSCLSVAAGRTGNLFVPSDIPPPVAHYTCQFPYSAYCHFSFLCFLRPKCVKWKFNVEVVFCSSAHIFHFPYFHSTLTRFRRWQVTLNRVLWVSLFGPAFSLYCLLHAKQEHYLLMQQAILRALWRHTYCIHYYYYYYYYHHHHHYFSVFLWRT